MSFTNQTLRKKKTKFKSCFSVEIQFHYPQSVDELDELIRSFKGALSGLRQFLATETFLTMMKNVFYFTSKSLFNLKIFKFLS